ncbi:MAG: hypothetical protein QGH66_00335 [Dehalococcoidia bacterium]|nr:hypothetical protein [Dehalococcoidia bacterium]
MGPVRKDGARGVGQQQCGIHQGYLAPALGEASGYGLKENAEGEEYGPVGHLDRESGQGNYPPAVQPWGLDP